MVADAARTPRRLVALAFAALLAGVASAQPVVAPPGHDPALSPAVIAAIGLPPRDRALVVVFQPRGSDGAGYFKVWAGENYIGRVNPGRYRVLVLPPGEHRFRTHRDDPGTPLRLAPGEAHFLTPVLYMGFWKGYRRLLPSHAVQFHLDLPHLKPAKK